MSEGFAGQLCWTPTETDCRGRPPMALNSGRWEVGTNIGVQGSAFNDFLPQQRKCSYEHPFRNRRRNRPKRTKLLAGALPSCTSPSPERRRRHG